MGAVEAIEASERLRNRGDLAAAIRVLDPYAGDRQADLQRGGVAADGVLLDGLHLNEVESILAPYLVESARALDLIGLARLHSAMTAGDHSVSEAVRECVAASRLMFDTPCWSAANVVHIGMAQQALGSHDIAAMYLRDGYRQAERCPSEQASAALHLGLDMFARSGSEPAVPLIEEALDIRRSNSMDAHIPETLVALATALEVSETDQQWKLLEEAVEIGRELRVRRPLAVSLAARGRLIHDRRDLEEAIEIARRIGDRKLAAATSQALEREI